MGIGKGMFFWALAREGVKIGCIQYIFLLSPTFMSRLNHCNLLCN
jgi:hypothetical protein